MKSDRPSVDPAEPAAQGQARLTLTESRLLEVLRSQPGQVFGRVELIALVMPDAVVLERTIDVHIKALRQKLGILRRLIETVRNAGYRFDPKPSQGEGGA